MPTSANPTESRKVATVAARWRPLAKATAMAVLGMMGAAAAQAESLIDLYQAAKGYDAGYLSAKAKAETVQYQLQQAYAGFKPSLGLGAGIKRSHFETSIDVPVQLQTTIPSSTQSTTKTVGLTATQTLFNKEIDSKIKQAELQLSVAQADLAVAENDLAAQLTQAYFDVLSAQDILTTTQANKKALAEQLASAKRNFEVGNATITDTREAQARYDLAGAQEIAATNDLQVKHIALDQLIGRADVKPSPLATPANLDQLATGQMDDWVTLTADAPVVRSAQGLLAIAKIEIENAKGKYLPTVNAQADWGRTYTDSSTITTKAQSGTAASIQIDLKVPLYSGGLIQNKVKEALSQVEKGEHDVDKAKRTVALTTRQVFSGVQSGLAQVKALEAAEGSAKLALEATQLGYRVGVRINKDVLDAQTTLSSVQKDLFKARYDVIVGSIKLKQAAGSLKPDDLVELNKLLVQ